MRAAVVSEVVKAVAAWAVRGSVAALVGGTAVLSLAFALAVRSGDAQIIAKVGAAGSAPGWSGLLAGATQVAAAGSLLALGVVASWVVGREFADGTVEGLFALAVGRAGIAIAKILVVAGVAAVSGVLLALGVLGVGVVLGYGVPAATDVAGLGRLAVLVVLSGLLALPCAWAATVGRGLLPGIGLAVALLAGTQVLVVAGAAFWFPTAAPALWALDPSVVPVASLLGGLVVGLVGAAGCARAWSRLQLDR